MISRTVFKDVAHQFKGYCPSPLELTSGILAIVFLSCALFAIKTYFSLTLVVFSLDAGVFVNGYVHKLFTYPFYHETIVQLILSIGALVLLCGSLEKSVGTVRFLFLFMLLSTCTGLWYAFVSLCQLYAFVSVFQDDTIQSHVEGFVPITLALVAMTTMHTRMAKGFLFGVSIPTMALPWAFLIIITIIIPHSVLPCNVIAILTGWIYGKGWFSFLDMSEARASVLEKKMPFRLLRNIGGVLYVPASIEERRKALHPQINPTPGSYPVQAYAPLSSIKTESPPKMYEGWPHSTYTPSSPVPPLGPAYSFGPSHGHTQGYSFGHSDSHSHGHGHSHSSDQL